jgi:hypothetical protein
VSVTGPSRAGAYDCYGAKWGILRQIAQLETTNEGMKDRKYGQSLNCGSIVKWYWSTLKGACYLLKNDFVLKRELLLRGNSYNVLKFPLK